MGRGRRRQRERPVEVRHCPSVDQPADGGAPRRVGSFQPVNERVSEAQPIENPPDGFRSDVDGVVLDQDEREGAAVELRFQERLYRIGVPPDGNDVVRPSGRRRHGHAEQRVATVVDEERLFHGRGRCFGALSVCEQSGAVRSAVLERLRRF